MKPKLEKAATEMLLKNYRTRGPGKHGKRFVNLQPQPEELTTEQVCQLSGATPRMLQWWDEQGLVTPIHVGHKRIYTPLDTTRAVNITRLRKAGLLSLQRIRKLLRFATPADITAILEAAVVLKRFKIGLR